ncbi:MAG: endonuclease domain-containing protein [Hyphomicrobium sp.]
MRSGLVSLARDLRKHETDAEHILWSRLRNRQIDGWKFKRQVPFGRFVLDFYCADARLAVEIDGGTHSTSAEIASDVDRTEFLEANGVRIVRCWNSEVRENIDGILEMIYLALGQVSAPSPGATRRPLPKGRGIDRAH